MPRLLFPDNVLSVYVDYACSRSAPTPPPLPRALLAEALAARHGARPIDLLIETVLDHAQRHRRVVVFAAAGIDAVYGNSDDVWTDFHSLVTKYEPVLFVTGGCGRRQLRAMVERRGYEAQLRTWFPNVKTLPNSLNGDKLSVIELV